MNLIIKALLIGSYKPIHSKISFALRIVINNKLKSIKRCSIMFSSVKTAQYNILDNK